MKFTLDIDMGNDAMQTSADVADALIHAAQIIDRDGNVAPTAIFDRNGNRIGRFMFVEDEA